MSDKMMSDIVERLKIARDSDHYIVLRDAIDSAITEIIRLRPTADSELVEELKQALDKRLQVNPRVSMTEGLIMARDIKAVIDSFFKDKAIQALSGGDVVVTTDESGKCVAVTRQDEDGKILSVIWEAEKGD